MSSAEVVEEEANAEVVEEVAQAAQAIHDFCSQQIFVTRFAPSLLSLAHYLLR